MKRGQTTLDFAFGMSIFLAIILFIFLFIPGILDPFTAGVQEETVTTNRVADELSHGLLGSTGTPKVLNRTCTVRFFDGDSPADCSYYDESTAPERMGLSDSENVNVTIYGNVSATGGTREILCWDNDDDTLSEQSGNCGGSDVQLTTGSSPPTNNADSVTATRVVSLYRTDVTMEVVMW